jgi:hypothetical protein
MSNSMLVLEMYRHAGTWVFTDEKRDLVNEPFVLGVPEIFDSVIEEQNLKGNHIYRVIFSDQNFPLAHAEVEKISEEGGGAWYKHKKTPPGWLCPATLKFFKEFPKRIFFKIEVIS